MQGWASGLPRARPCASVRRRARACTTPFWPLSTDGNLWAGRPFPIVSYDLADGHPAATAAPRTLANGGGRWRTE